MTEIYGRKKAGADSLGARFRCATNFDHSSVFRLACFLLLSATHFESACV